jgi:hypothetical protein
MSDEKKIAEPELPVPAQPVPLVTPSPTLYGELATGLITDLDQFSANVPGFDDETVTTDFVRRKQRISPEFINRAVGALFGDGELLAVKSLNAAEAMDDKQYIDAMLPVEQKLLVVYRRLRFTIRIRQARLARTAQQIYGIAKELARDRDTSTINLHVQDMAKVKNVKVVQRKTKPDEATKPAAGKEGEPTTNKQMTC